MGKQHKRGLNLGGMADDTGVDVRRGQMLERLIELGIALSAERDHDRLMERILLEAKDLTNADGGTLYLRTEEDTLRFTILRNDSLNIAMGGTTGKDIPFPPLPMALADGTPNHNNVCTHAALTGTSINIVDAYEAEGFDFSGTKKFDAGDRLPLQVLSDDPAKELRRRGDRGTPTHQCAGQRWHCHSLRR